MMMGSEICGSSYIHFLFLIDILLTYALCQKYHVIRDFLFPKFLLDQPFCIALRH